MPSSSRSPKTASTKAAGGATTSGKTEAPGKNVKKNMPKAAARDGKAHNSAAKNSAPDLEPLAEVAVAPQPPELSQRQQEILDIIRSSIRERGFPPSIREIGEAAGLASTSSVAHQLRSLQQKGYLRREANRPRAVDTRAISAPSGELTPESEEPQSQPQPTAVLVPLLGRIAAGAPVLAEEHVEDLFPLPRELVGTDAAFLLSVTGDSMVDAGVHDGDWVVVRPTKTPVYDGEIVAALFDDEATVKTLRRHGREVWLYPENKAYQPFRGEKAKILGKVIAVLRKLNPML
ncbi:transcriptional repressor, LexA family [Segniliparus rotundus DSM 44985]|uniref:LexA repressor n=1 Tax=Segniliparus rotundus (strain ATCC BAA-972 / CDC 1076 / CIP 108378 / DSM 44985 / JCM 13578) TaxID=640132 RepID=D6ZEQ0_SEGRD|nr:transcriptional repressor LexA [Segniliparus rotundus]ADG97424.1 transcriptional repressor, LexA family [Segniliparus rotundus DSM 44985]